MTTPKHAARHAIAIALGIEPSGQPCTCVVCGPSAFASAGAWRKVFGAGFSDWDQCERSGRART